MHTTIEGGEQIGHENKLFDFDLIIQEKDKKAAGDGKKIRVKKQQEIKILWKKYKSGKIVGQPANSSEIIQFEKDGKKYDITVRELILNKGLFMDKIEWVKFSPDLRLIPYSAPIENYPPYHVCYLNPVEFRKDTIKLVKPWKTRRIVGVGVLAAVVLGVLLFYLAKFLKKVKKKSKNSR